MQDMDTDAVTCTCGHTEERHAIRHSPYTGACMVAKCKCCNFTCPECGETYGLHTARCRHSPRIPWNTPAQR
jgi:hypothetical protein